MSVDKELENSKVVEIEGKKVVFAKTSLASFKKASDEEEKQILSNTNHHFLLKCDD